MTDLRPQDTDRDIRLTADDLPPLTEAELEAQALAAPRSDVADEDAIPYWEMTDRQDMGQLPDWYMPTSPAGTRQLVGWKRNLAWGLVGTFLAIDAAGLCSTYGRIEGWGIGFGF